WISWPLGSFGVVTGGLKRVRTSYASSSLVFVRTPIAIVKVDTVSDTATTYCDVPVGDPVTKQTTGCTLSQSPVSDVSIDNRNNVYYTFNGMLQRVNANANSCATQPCTPVVVTRWDLNPSAGGVSSAGLCKGGSSTTNPCLAGVAVHPKYQNLVYVAEPQN